MTTSIISIVSLLKLGCFKNEWKPFYVLSPEFQSLVEVELVRIFVHLDSWMNLVFLGFPCFPTVLYQALTIADLDFSIY